mgnify:CR=1 FL=1
MSNIENIIRNAGYVLKKQNIPSYNLDAEILLAKVLKKKREYLITNLKKKINDRELAEFNKLLRRRELREPIAYITKKKDFWKNSFFVEKNVLIPRPDTEIVMNEILKIFKFKERLNVLEIGTGTGCIILSLLNEKKNFKGVGIDIDQKCIDISRKNAINLNLGNKIKFYKCDVDNFNLGKYDLIISNPPYIKKMFLRYLDKDILNFEPKLALDGGLDGLSKIRKVVLKSSSLLKINGKLILEIGFDQKVKVKKILNENSFYVNDFKKDLAGNYRCVISTKI